MTMDDTIKAQYEAQAKELRASLKKWENDWASSHNGEKPGRQDIKENPDIGKWLFDIQRQLVFCRSLPLNL